MRSLLALLVCGLAATASAQQPSQVTLEKSALPADRHGHCQRTEFIGWRIDGALAAFAESYCKLPSGKSAHDSLYVTDRDGAVRQAITGAAAGATMARETRASLLFGDFHRQAGGKAPKGPLSARARVEGDYLLVAFASSDKSVKAPPPVSQEVKLPYDGWEDAAAPKAGEVFWSPDGKALAVTLTGEKKTPEGGRLKVSSVYFAELQPLQPKAPPSAGGQ